ncbi:MAG: HIT family protein [Acholeplasmatales bacterium]|nr:HIT family protein [Acholeplasmatales bacterium]
MINVIKKRKENNNMCIFCKIVNGEIPSKKVYEDDDVLAILDISQATVGHTLVMPKKHYANILEIPNNEYQKVMLKVKEIANKLNTKLNPKGINVLNNCGEAAGQTVMHYHVHILPRYNDNDIKLEFTDHSSNVNLDDILKEIND